MRLVLLMILLLQTTVSIPPLMFTAIECTRDNDVCTDSFCFLSTKRPNQNLANYGFYIAKPQKTAYVRTQFYNRHGGKYVPVGPRFYEAICNMSIARSRSLAFVIRLNSLAEYSTNFQFPFVNNVTIMDFPPDVMLFPSFVTTKQYKLTFSVGNLATNKSYFSVSLYLQTTWV